METIRNYLESMFAHLPNTPEVVRAKTELGQMMEDKYSELIEEGKTENEAIGIVISEFGNLEEVAEELGIRDYLDKEPEVEPERTIPFEEIREFLEDRGRIAYQAAFGVLLLIVSSVPVIILRGIASTNSMSMGVATAVGVLCLFLMLAAGLGLLIYAGLLTKACNSRFSQGGRIDYAGREYIRNQFAQSRPTHTILIVVGIVLCVLCGLPGAITGIASSTRLVFADGIGLEIPASASHLSGSVSGDLTLILAGAAVFLFVLAGCQKGSFNRLLKVKQPRSTRSGESAADRMDEIDSDEAIIYDNETLSKVMDVYWPTVTCLYLTLSFLTFKWGITWIIWPVAGIAHAFIQKAFGRHVYE